jgi:hypothetical protein
MINYLQVLSRGYLSFGRMGLLHWLAGKIKVRHLESKAAKNCATSNRAGRKLRHLRG